MASAAQLIEDAAGTQRRLGVHVPHVGVPGRAWGQTFGSEPLQLGDRAHSLQTAAQ